MIEIRKPLNKLFRLFPSVLVYLAMSSSALARDTYCNGQRKVDGNFQRVYPNAVRIVDGNYKHQYPNGQRLTNGDYKEVYPNGSRRYNSRDIEFYPNGFPTSDGRQNALYPDGRRICSSGVHCPKSARVRTTIEGFGKLLIRVGVDENVGKLSDFVYETIEQNGVITHFEVDADDWKVTEVDAECVIPQID